MNAMPHAPIFQSIPVEILESEITRRRLGYLSGFSNALMVVAVCFLGLVASLATPLLQQYPIESTLRPAQKRPLVLIGADGQPFAKRGDCVAESGELKRNAAASRRRGGLSMEDRRFYSHIGIDPVGILRAAKRNYDAGARARRRQHHHPAARQNVVSDQRQNPGPQDGRGAARHAGWSCGCPRMQILERYLSSAYFGEGCFGVRAAARHFFDKPVGRSDASANRR